MKVLFAASECVPFVKTGGLADVAGTLPVAMAQKGVEVAVILPKYREINDYWRQRMRPVTSFYINLGWRTQYCGIEAIDYEGVTFYFVDNQFYFSRESVYGSGMEEGERFAYFCRAVLEALPKLNLRPDVLHCNDWQTGMIPALLRLQYSNIEFYSNIKTVFSIHNLRYQGVFPWSFIDDMLGLGEKHYTPEELEYYGCMSFVKGALVYSDVINTVSPTYANEIQTPYYGEKLDGMLRKRSGSLRGILNGIDNLQYDPATNQYIPEHYTPMELSGKLECKLALQQELGLVIDPNRPLIGMVGRLTEQKGFDLVERVLDDMMRLGVQLVVVGTGDERYAELFTWAAWRYSGQLAAVLEYNEAISQRVYAGSDMFLMPSRFEPCGLSQFIALRYGTVPIVRETGGLKDTITPYNKYTDEGNGFSFANYNAHEMLYTIESALGYYQDKELWQRLMRRGMACDFSWESSAEKYIEMYDALVGAQPQPEAPPQEQPIKEEAPQVDVKPAEEAKPAAKTAKAAQKEQAPKEQTPKAQPPKERTITKTAKAKTAKAQSVKTQTAKAQSAKTQTVKAQSVKTQTGKPAAQKAAAKADVASDTPTEGTKKRGRPKKNQN